jgi:ketosteroid isomerase-like protein
VTSRRATAPVTAPVFAAQFAAMFALLLAGCATASTHERAQIEAEVTTAERAFAQSMADRDVNAFARFISRDAVFFSSARILRGRPAVVEAWKAFYAGPGAPFSWQPEQVEALDSGELALSTGPVRDPDGKLVARFTSIWRREGPHTWRVVYDKGNDVCDCAAPGK